MYPLGLTHSQQSGSVALPMSPAVITDAYYPVPRGTSLKQRLALKLMGYYPFLRWSRFIMGLACLGFIAAGALSSEIYIDFDRNRGSSWGIISARLSRNEAFGSIDWDSTRQLFCHYVTTAFYPEAQKNSLFLIYPPGGTVNIESLCQYLSQMESTIYWACYGLSGAVLAHLCGIIAVTIVLRDLPKRSVYMRKHIVICIFIMSITVAGPVIFFFFWNNRFMKIRYTGLSVMQGKGFYFILIGLFAVAYGLATLLLELVLSLLLFDFDPEELNIQKVDSLLSKARRGGLLHQTLYEQRRFSYPLGQSYAQNPLAPGVNTLYNATSNSGPQDYNYPQAEVQSTFLSPLRHPALMSPTEILRRASLAESCVAEVAAPHLRSQF